MENLLGILVAWILVSTLLIFAYVLTIRKNSIDSDFKDLYVGDFIFGVICLPLTLCYIFYKVCRIKLDQSPR